MGRPAFQPTDAERRLVEAMAGYGIPHDEIALVIQRPKGKKRHPAPIDPKTLRKHFRAELDTGAVKAKSKVAEALYQTATDRKHKGHVAAAIFFLKARAGWSERVQHDHSGALQLDLSGLSDDELAVIEKLLKRRAEFNGLFRPANAA